ncbi:hypothetical protein [Actinopolyspora lacussalsi]
MSEHCSDGLFINPNGEQGNLDMPTGTARRSGGKGDRLRHSASGV